MTVPHPPPSSGDGRPSESALAGLVREVDALRRAIEPLLALPERVDDLTGLASDLTNAVAALTTRRAATPCPSWLMLPNDPDIAGRVLGDLSGWLAFVYLRYPDGTEGLPECWSFHPDVVEELLWLMHAWAAAYQGQQASVALVGDWHDRQRPGVVKRIRLGAGSCSYENHQTRAGWTRRPSAAPEVPGVEHLPSVAAWWGARRDAEAPEPAVPLRTGGAR